MAAVQAGSRAVAATVCGTKFSYLARQSPLSSVFASSNRALFCSLSQRRFAAQSVQPHKGDHAAAPSVTPRFTDDIPAEYYRYGAFKNYRRDDSCAQPLVRMGVVVTAVTGLIFLNHMWSCDHWHYKHRIAGSYLDSDSE
ncbi:hypothetical protein BESB_077270 [Besnoitia besnoiti]|uniref:Transmembrane protein n=1 Tax=Besnoitia besnoiti TaxID=94643 RepID=A0A2A9MDQ4_BESBE|nr:hypothetical protein BESB_077270 [Besnoitia besnoiti]PFH33510.1 hypothetical protein BESB_077270 [Besnoitia besnoiti]